MQDGLPPPPAYHGKRPSQVPNNLSSRGYVYLRQDANAKPLVRPNTGPFKIIVARDKCFAGGGGMWQRS